jgi:hypothetical protein
MSQADDDFTIVGPIRLSTLISNPVVREAFRRAERDQEHSFAVPPQRPSGLVGGAVAPLPALGEREGGHSRDLVRVVVATLALASIFVGAMLPVLP